MEVCTLFPGGILVIDVQADAPTSMRCVSAQSLLAEELADASYVGFGAGDVMRDIAPGELANAVADGCPVAGYGYVVGDLREPTPQQHNALIAQSRALGRYLTAAEVASVVGADGGHDAHE